VGRRIALAAAAVPAGLVLVLGAEILHAVTGPTLPARDPLELSGEIGRDSNGEALDMAWIGDSVSAGVGASSVDSALPRVVAGALGRPVRLHVFATAGERVAGALAEQVPRLEGLGISPDIVIVQIGANDVTHLTGPGTFREEYERLLDRVRGVGPELVIALGIPAFETTPRFLQPLRALVGWRARRLDREVRGAAEAAGATYVDIAGVTADPFDEDPDRYYAADEYHPSDAGYALWAAAVLRALDDAGIARGGGPTAEGP
jgi:lysophospholipase L1-like esterase